MFFEPGVCRNSSPSTSSSASIKTGEGIISVSTVNSKRQSQSFSQGDNDDGEKMAESHAESNYGTLQVRKTSYHRQFYLFIFQ